MIRDLSQSNFSECTMHLAKQITPLSNISSKLSAAISAEGGTEFVDEYMKSQYSQLSSLISQRKSNVIDYQITLGKKSVYISNDDKNGAAKLEASLGEMSTSSDLVHSMRQSIVSCISSLTGPDASVEGLIGVLPEDRANDIKNGNLFMSEDCKYLYYNGYEYEIFDPFKEHNNITGPTIGRPEEWETVHIKSYDETTWDWWGAIANLNNMSSDDYAGAMVDNNSRALNNFDAVFSVIKFIGSAKQDVSIEVNFQQNQYGDRRVIIGVDNSTYKQMYNNNAGNTISRLDMCGDGAAKLMWSRAAAEYYSQQTGNPVNTYKYNYDIETTIDEGHKDQKYTSTISFDENGAMTESILLLPNDKVVIREEGSFLGITGKDVYTIKLNSTSVVPEQYSNLFRQGLNNGFD